ncbi:ABC transporter permease subunit [Neobacillus sp. MM2021_6]|uniref:ABC transporter permease subunit n=1 Tax=Bacillaceae TaxID=186817 RepID=UPI00140B6EF4|nr:MULTISPECIES: ABC transporter permease subunit [Bacillaceae]MBO0962251.1 ABC transporter permease subunit [Neobacillus sp. MM2021_6]NHC18265.1 ABC transporter permease subunit [Bacillus sp. MM2020_4]
MAIFLLKRKRFMVSVLFLVTLFTWSIINNGDIRQLRFHTDERGNLIDAPPYPPLTVFLLGSDKYGYDLGQMMIEGAKYTIGITLLVAILRMILSIIMSAFIYSLRPRIYSVLKSIFEPFSVVPQTIIAYFILHTVLWMPIEGFSTPFWQRALFETIILVIIAIPNLTIHLSGEMRQVEKEPFIEAAKILGASKTSVFFKHIVPHVYEKWILLFGQQFIQSLQLLAHLGFLNLFFGGSFIAYGESIDPPRSISYEWSGVIGSSISYIFSYQWIILVPIGFFMLTAISVALINDSVKAFFQNKAINQAKR